MSTHRTIFVTKQDLERLERFIDTLPDRARTANVDELEEELAAAEVVAPRDIPANVVTMNSRVRFLDEESGEEQEVELVYPSDADVERRRVSVLAPVGSALIGLSAGQSIAWPAPGGVRRLQILEVLYQPEAAGDFNA